MNISPTSPSATTSSVRSAFSTHPHRRATTSRSIVGMLHDLVKCKCYKSEERENAETWAMSRNKETVIVYKQPAYPGHGVASALIITAELGLMLLPAEQTAIVGHMGAFCLADKELKEYDAMLDAYPREIIATHTADMLASRVDEATIMTQTKENK